MSRLKEAMDKRGMKPRILQDIGKINYSWALRCYKGEKEVSAKHAIIYEELLGIPRSELRPDFWPPEIYDFSKKKPVDALPVS